MNENLIDRIISGYQLIKYNNIFYKLIKPTIDLKIAANILRQDTYNDNLYSGLLSKENLKDFLVSSGIISDNFDEQLKITEKRLEKAKIDLFKNFYSPKLKSKAKNTIKSLNHTINTAYSQKHAFDFLSLENYCDNIKNEFIIAKTLYDKHDDLVFDNYPNICYVKFNDIAQIIASNLISVSEYKRIARSEEWRKIYSPSYSSIFPGSASEYSEEQKALLNITRMYDKIYEHPECPEQDLIEDDDALDGWMLYHQEQNKKQKMEKGVDKSLGKHAGAGEVFVMTGQNQEDINKVLELNSQAALNKIKSRTSIEEGKVLEDTEFSDTRNEIRQKIMELNKRK